MKNREPDLVPLDGSSDTGFALAGTLGGHEIFLPLASGANVLGSDPSSHVVLDEEGVSRRHALLWVERRGVRLIDERSKNGTFVNSRRVTSALLAIGDEVEIGPVELRLEAVRPEDLQVAFEITSEAPRPEPPRSRSTARMPRPPAAGPASTARPAPRLRFPPGHVVGSSPTTSDLYAQMEMLAAGDLPVLIVGETGVGKEHLARTLHLSSARSTAPFVAINCAAIPAELLEAELFGIGKGVATGVAARPGRFALAHGGTLFLDEIGELPAALQAKLLRALQEKEIQPVGEKPFAVDVRILSATNVDIASRLDSGRFRRDLYYRLAGFKLQVPPLRERRDDIPPLAEHFLRRFATDAGKQVHGLSVAALRRLQDYPWPGNVRELEHELRRLVLSCPPGQVIRSSMLSEEIQPAVRETAGPCDEPVGPDDAPLPTLDLAELEALALRAALRRSRGNQAGAARLLGISRFSLRRRLDRHGL